MNQKLVAGAILLSFSLCGCGGHRATAGAPGNDESRDEATVIAPSPVCTGDLKPGLQVIITDASTGAPAVNGSTAVISDGTYTETLHPNAFSVDSDGTWIYYLTEGAVERRGTYSLQVTRPGYETYVQNNIVVTGGVCGVYTQKITVALKPLASL